MTNDKKEVRHYIGAAGIFVLIVALLLFLSFVEIPPVNKDLFVAIVGTLVSSLGMVVYTIIGQQPDEVNKLQKKNESLTSINNQMETRNDQLEQMIIDMQKEMIEKLTELKTQLKNKIMATLKKLQRKKLHRKKKKK
jgi:cell division protein FtsB